jgi:dipeptidyl aminopeptidase/acylaminoacyl peptidase
MPTRFRPRTLWRYLFAAIFMVSSVAAEAQKRTLEISDCLAMKTLDPFERPQLDSSGTFLAYVVRAADHDDDRKNSQLYVTNLHGAASTPSVPILAGEDIGQFRWIGHTDHLALLERMGKVLSILDLNVQTGQTKTIVKTDRDILDYSISRDGSTIVFAAPSIIYGQQSAGGLGAQQLAEGYRVVYGDRNAATDETDTALLFAVHRRSGGTWTAPGLLVYRDRPAARSLPLATSAYGRVSFLSLSPDGTKLIYNLDWKITALYNLGNQEASEAFESAPRSPARWSRDGESFLLTAAPPAGTPWAEEAKQQRLTHGDDDCLFWVSTASGRTDRVFGFFEEDHEEPLFWTDNGEVVLHIRGRTIARFRRDESGGWKETSRFEIPLKDFYRYSPLTGTSTEVIGVYSTPDTPPDLFAYNPSDNAARMLTKLNPQFDSLTLASVENLEWETTEHTTEHGLLYLPIGAIPGKRYPLVIQTKGNQGHFACDDIDPSFQPEPMANVGLMYLVHTVPGGMQRASDEGGTPQKYPGHIGEVVDEMRMWESAVQELDRRGLVDPSRVGIIGFSRTGWYVEFFLAHSKIHYAAATATDNTQYSLGERWLFNVNSNIDDIDGMYGGPPFGTTLTNWMNYSVSFNLDKFHSPLLMENMGYGALDDTPGKIPLNLAYPYEVFVGLSSLNKPVEMYYYPEDEHRPTDVRARRANLVRNLDWYRFWLQDYEDPAPSKKEQYVRWRHLRELRDADNKPVAQPQANEPKPN